MGADSPYPKNVEDKVVSVLTVNAVRYQGVVHSIVLENNSVTLKDVTVFGTEDREVQNKIPPQPDTFEYVILSGDNIKEVILYEYVPLPPPSHEKGPPPTAAQANGVAAPSVNSSYLDIVRGKQEAAKEMPAGHQQNVKYNEGQHGGKGGKGHKGKGKGRHYGEYSRRP